MAIIWVDCDEVLSETVDELLKREFFKKKNIIKEDITSYNFWEVEKIWITQEEWVNLFFSFFATDDMLKIKPVKWAKEKLTELKNAWHKLVVVTARAEQFKERTIKRININYPWLFSDYLFMNQFKENEVPKSKLCKDFWIELLIDDSINNINDINKVWIPWILLDKPWNRSAEESELLKRAMSREDVDVSIFFKKE
jgi:uncharacterized HAD superfamily protein